jgi:LmbE family N-acetylglucosaminyl deacetylase
MPTALFLSPHLDDVVFSCGGVLAALADQGWRTVLATAFTASIHPATGFALACQLDKGLSPDIDYMALRREEDRRAAALLGVADLRWLDLPEAPHRGYASAPELFADIRADDEVWRPLADQLRSLLHELDPALTFAPQGLGNHVDHRQLIRALQAIEAPIAGSYRDTPYAIRHPDAQPHVPLGPASAMSIAATLDRKIAAACAYASQIGFQFGGPEAAAAALRDFAIREGGGEPCEILAMGAPDATSAHPGLGAAIMSRFKPAP